MPAHKVVGDVGKPGQIVNPINTDMMDEMSQYSTPTQRAAVAAHKRFWAWAASEMRGNTESAPTAATYKPTHGGYPTPAPYASDVKRP
jgi:hypothetical protein